MNEFRRGLKIFCGYLKSPSNAVEPSKTVLDYLWEEADDIPLLSMLCHICGDATHEASRCPEIVCHGCGKRGHIASACSHSVCLRCHGSHRTSACPGKKPSSYLTAASTLTSSKVVHAEEVLNNSLSVDLVTRVINWTVADFTNEQLLRAELNQIPRTFANSCEYFQTFYPHVLEEFRSQIKQLTEKGFDDINKYQFEVNINKYQFEVNPQRDGAESAQLTVRAGANLATVMETPPSLALIVERSRVPLYVSNLCKLRHMIIAISIDRNDKKKRQELQSTDVYFNARLPTSSDFTRLLSEPSDVIQWDLHILDIGTTAPVRIANALLRKEIPCFMGNILSGRFEQNIMTSGIALCSDDFEKSNCFSKLLNSSQKESIEKILDVGLGHISPIQLIKGPPGILVIA